MLRVPKVGTDRYYVVQMFDLFTFNFAYVGVRATGFEAGDYLIASPDWDGETPDGIADVLRCETELAGTLTRTALFGSDDMPNVRAIQHGYAIQPLSEYAGLRPPPPAPDLAFPEWNEPRALSSGFIGYLNFLLGLVKPHPSEAELYERLAKIGIVAGRAWRPEDVPPDVLAAIEDGAKQGLADIDAQASHTTSSIGIFGSREQLGDDYLTRAVAAQMGIYGQVAEEAVYGGSRLDSQRRPAGRRPDVHAAIRQGRAAAGEVLLVADAVPAAQSAARRQPDRPLLDRRPDRRHRVHHDGSLEIALQPDEPTDPVHRANWLPTPEERAVHRHLPDVRPRRGRAGRELGPLPAINRKS